MIQPDGKIVAVGSNRDADWRVTDFVLARYNTDGSLDSSFDGDGKATISFAEFDYAYDVAVQPDGKIVVSGSSDYKSFALARLNPDGSLDSGFGTGGKVTSDFDGFYGASAIALQPDGKIVAVGSTRASTYQDFALARYNPDGSPDASFDGDGRLVTYLTSKDDVASSVALQPDGKILVGGEANYSSTLVRYETDGSLDASFGSGGKSVSADNYWALSDLALQSDGKIVALGRGSLLVRYKPDGSIDPSLYTTSQVGGYSLELQPDGKVVVAGVGGSGGFKDFALARFLGGTDDDPPDTTLTSGPPPFTSSTWETFYFSSSEARTSFRCSLDGAAFSHCLEQNGEFFASYMYLAQGQHTFRVAAVDEANNVDPTPASQTWTVDSVAPRVP